MNTRTVLAGAIVWTIGLLVPLLYHVALMHLAIQEDGYSYSYHSMVKYFFQMPWIVWPYIIAMAVTGCTLVARGAARKPPAF